MSDHEHGWGKIREGQPYVTFPVDLARAIFALGLGANVSLLLWHVIETSWGLPRKNGIWPDPVPCRIEASELAKAWGVPRQRVYEAKVWLLKARLLKPAAGSFLVDTQVDQWIDPADLAPLLSAQKLAYAAAAQGRDSRNLASPFTSHPMARAFKAGFPRAIETPSEDLSWDDLRDKVLARDGYACVYCGSTATPLHCDHVIPRSQGGATTPGNLATACAECNLWKGTRSLEDWVQ